MDRVNGRPCYCSIGAGGTPCIDRKYCDALREIERLKKENEILAHPERIQWRDEEIERLRTINRDLSRDIGQENERLRAALADAHDVLANGGDLNTDTYQTRCNRALAITREALQEGES